jgi:hypothetical protein
MARRKTERVILYEPLVSQRTFHESGARFKGFSGPIGSGKSQALCQEAIKLTYLNPGRMGLIGAPTYPMLRDTTQAALLEVLTRNQIPHELNKAENTITMGDTKSRIVFRAVDDFERLRGSNLAWFGVDELTYCPEDAWLRLEGRLRDPKAQRLCGFAVWTPKGYDWVYRKFIARPVEGYEAVIARPRENVHILRVVPDFYDRLKASYDEAFYKQEVLGEYVNLNSSLVYSSFCRADHVQKLEKEEGGPLLWALDFNVDPMASVVAQVSRGTVRVLDEIVLRHATTLDACREFSRRFPAHRRGLVIYGDASGNQRQTTGDTDYQIIREYFKTYGRQVAYKVPRSNPSVRDRVMLTNSKLRNAGGEVQMYIDARCAELILDFEQVSYKADSTQIDKERDRHRTHLSDALGYLIWQECRTVSEPGERGGRLL